jgi:hypothetical protein
MANKRITDLPSISTIDTANDKLVIVDVSDTTSAASGTTKKMTPAQLVGGINGVYPFISSGTTVNPNGVVTAPTGSIYFNITNPSVPVQWVKTGASWVIV